MPTPTLHDPALCQALLRRLEDLLDRPMRFMEVCGTHTVSIFRGGLRSLLPATVTPRARLPRLRHPRPRSGRLPPSG